MQRVAILYDASQAVLSTFDLDEVLKQILSILRDYFNLPRAAILLLNPETQVLQVRSQTGWPLDNPARSLSLGVGITGTAAKLKRPIYAPDVTRDPRYVMSFPATKSELAIPLTVRDEVVGVLDCQSDKDDFFQPDTIDLLMLFATQASIALQNARLYSLEQRRAAQLEAINLIAKETTSALELRVLLQKVCHHTLNSFHLDHVCVLLLQDGQLVLSGHDGKMTLRVPEGTRLPPGAGLCAQALQSGKAVLANDVSKVPGYIAGFEETWAELCVPLVSFGDTLGVLTLESATPGTFDTSDIEPLESVADICANAIQNVRYIERMKQLAYIDGLTGTFNRRLFEVRILEEIERANRYQGSMSVLMVDLDEFKRLNDDFGHLLGDETLRQISSIFVQYLRKADIVCRYGGEEFAIIVPETPAEGAVQVAEKLRRTVEGWHFPGVPRPVTISVGVAEYPANGPTRDKLVHAADSALYAAKQAGRNRVISAAYSRETSA